ncbi:MAG: transglutaminase-like domain-containing protein [bacterium]
MKKIIGILILIGIIAITILLISNIPGNAKPEQEKTQTEEVKDIQEEWLGIFIQGARVGYSFTKVMTFGSGLTIENRSQMTINMMNRITTLATHLYVQTDTTYAMNNFSISISTAGHESKIKGVIKDKKLILTNYSQGIEQTQVKEIKEKPYFPDAIDQIVKKKNLKPGDEISIPYFDPTSQTSGQAKLKVYPDEMVMVVDKQFMGKKVEINFLGMVSYLWLDNNYHIIKSEIPNLRMEMIPMTKEEALAEIKSQGAFDLLGFFSIKLPVPLPEDKNINFLKLKLNDLQTEGLDLSDDYQKVVSKEPLTVEIIRADINGLNDFQGTSRTHQEFLTPSAYIQCDNPEIIKEAKKITGNEKSAIVRTKKLVNAVHQMIRKVATPSMPSAIDVLKTKEGDCNEHAVLFTALARASGIPTKIYVGLVNLEGNAYFYHAWCAVYLGKWVPVDPTFNQFPADVYHLKLKEGEISDWAEVLKVVGKLKIEVMEYK